MNLLIFGLGYSAGHYVAAHADGFDSIVATRRAPESADFGRAKLVGFDSAAPRVEPALARALETADALLVSAGPDADGDPVLRRLFGEIDGAPRLRTIVYLSTVGVYGDSGGGWIDEACPLNPTSPRNLWRARAEEQWTSLARQTGKGLFILRLAGIYGPGRNALASLKAGAAKRIVKPGQVFNRIHVEDIARSIEAAFASAASGGVFNVADNEPAPPQDVVAFAARLMGVAPPPEQDFASADLSAMARSFYAANKRVSNKKLREQLKVDLAFPTYREGIAALWAADEGR